MASDLAKTYSNGYIGLSYLKQANDDNNSLKKTNHFTLITPNGKVAWNYEKANPVPIVESDITAGPAILPTFDSPTLGKLGGSICFDLDYPEFVKQAGFKHVDLMLQPSWTWNAINYRFLTNFLN